jgi:hypothetical protein
LIALLQAVPEPRDGDADSRLAEFGLSVELLHQVARPGLSKALNRTRVANPGAQSNDLYQDTSEQLRLRLSRTGWEPVNVDQQIRTVHPEGKMAIVVASADHVGSIAGDPKRGPITRPKGPATHGAISASFPVSADGMLDIPDLPPAKAQFREFAKSAPLWMLLHEFTSNGLLLELSQPAGYRSDGRVDKWGPRIVLPPLNVVSDTSAFSADEVDGFDIPVQPR